MATKSKLPPAGPTLGAARFQGPLWASSSQAATRFAMDCRSPCNRTTPARRRSTPWLKALVERDTSEVKLLAANSVALVELELARIRKTRAVLFNDINVGLDDARSVNPITAQCGNTNTQRRPAITADCHAPNLYHHRPSCSDESYISRFAFGFKAACYCISALKRSVNWPEMSHCHSYMRAKKSRLSIVILIGSKPWILSRSSGRYWRVR
jgi:hypothetical protein